MAKCRKRGSGGEKPGGPKRSGARRRRKTRAKREIKRSVRPDVISRMAVDENRKAAKSRRENLRDGRRETRLCRNFGETAVTWTLLLISGWRRDAGDDRRNEQFRNTVCLRAITSLFVRRISELFAVNFRPREVGTNTTDVMIRRSKSE